MDALENVEQCLLEWEGNCSLSDSTEAADVYNISVWTASSMTLTEKGLSGEEVPRQDRNNDPT